MQSEVASSVRRFQSKDHEIFTIEQTKWAYSASDTKRAWVDDNTSLPYGHHSLEPPAKKAKIEKVELPKILESSKPIDLSLLARNHTIPNTSKSFPCILCNKIYNNDHNLKSHKCKNKQPKEFSCASCNLIFDNEHNLKSHKCKNIQAKIFSCSICDKVFNNKYNYKTHMGYKHII